MLTMFFSWSKACEITWNDESLGLFVCEYKHNYSSLEISQTARFDFCFASV